MGYSWAWITGFAILSLTANIVFLIGCISPATKDICLYRVNVTLLADGLHNLALVDSGNETDLLVPPELPTYWYWGMAGICDVFEKTGETRCRRAFPPTQNLLGILEGSLTDRLGDDQGQRVGDIVSSWNATLHKISPDRLVAKEAKFAAQSKASAALAILAIILDAATPVLASCLLSDQSRRRAYIAPLLSALIAMAAGTLATLTMRDGVHGIVDTTEHGGPAIIIVFVGAALRLLSCVGACGGSRNKLRMTRNEKIGFRGEQHVYSWLERQLPEWSYGNWTSNLRIHANYPEFTEPESRYADFTYDDRDGSMLQVLAKAGAPVSPQWSAGTRYHLEVKSTPAGCDAKFFVSEHQVRLMERYAGDPLNAYILVRVFHVERKPPAMRFFHDPLSHPDLTWGALGDDGYYPVWTKS